jgi:hypothetical protein
VFRFILARPALRDSDSISVAPQFRKVALTELSAALKTNTGPLARVPEEFTHVDKINSLDRLLPKNLHDAKSVRHGISTALPGQSLADLIAQDTWSRDEDLLDLELIRIYVAGRDPEAKGPGIARQRQLYDLVRQAADTSVGTKGHPAFKLKGLELSLAPPITTTPAALKTLQSASVATDDNAKRIANLDESLKILNSKEVWNFIDSAGPKSKIQLKPSWTSLLSPDTRAIMESGIVDSSGASTSIDTLYTTILQAIKLTRSADSVSQDSFQKGIYSVGNLSLELSKPWSIPIAAPSDGTVADGNIPTEKPSLISPTGIGDLIIVREHVWEYVGGEIGNIQNVLKSEKMLRETRRLDRTETVTVTSDERQTEEERDSSSTERFSLSKEASNVVKNDSASKDGVSVSASYGPTVQVKADISVATNTSQESATKTASQYSQDVTSRAATKVMEKTFQSTSVTNISQFQEHFRHEFDNADAKDTNIAGVYQWVNKVSQCQMYNYGKRLLIDVVIPEPAAFLMSNLGNGAPKVAKPQELVETADSLNEGNYAIIAARYNATGVTAPPDQIYFTSMSFKTDGAMTDETSASMTVDVEVPAGYVAFSAKVEVGVRTGNAPTDDTGGPRRTNTFVSVAGQLVDPGTLDTNGEVSFDLPFLSKTVAVSISQEMYVAMSGTVQISCLRSVIGYRTWQLLTYDTIATAYSKLKMDYDRSVTEAAISSMSVVTGSNPDDNAKIVRDELKKTCIAFMTAHNFEIFGTVEANASDQIPEVTDFAKAIEQGRYLEFFEQAFEWENLQYLLYPYFWARRSNWADRVSFQSPDPDFTSFVKSGAAKVTIPARLGFSVEVIHFLETGQPWMDGPVSELKTSPFYSAAQEIDAAEASSGTETAVGKPWYTVVPTELVRLRDDSSLPRFELDSDGVWIEKKPSEP